MKRLLFIVIALFVAQGLAAQALSPEELAKRAKRKNLTVKEWNTDSNKKQRKLFSFLHRYDCEKRQQHAAENQNAIRRI